jgi:hypothetical protein
VNLLQVSTTSANVTLDLATGAVDVAPATPVGTYTVIYRICEQLNPTNCDTADVVVTVGAAPIVATDDSGSVSSGATGGTAVADVLINDTLNGVAATLAIVNLLQVSTTSANVTLDATTGAVNVAPATPVGTYTVVYQICEQLNPANCTTGTVTATVGAAPIVATDDSGTVSSGASGGTAVADVLVNDSLNGAPATLATVNLSQVSTTNANVTLDVATGAVTVAPGTAAGTYTVVYQICEQLNPANCATGTVTVTVGAAPIVATDDSGSVSSGATGGTAVADVLVNDTLNGVAATLATISLTQVSTTNPNVTLNPATGAVTVAPGTAAGTYTVVYQICEQLNPANCTTGTVAVTVGAAPIVATDDSGSIGSGATGGMAVADVLGNDTLNGVPATLATVILTQVSTTSATVTLEPATGSVSAAAGTAAGTYTVVYQICEQLNPANCDTADVVVTVGAAPIVASDDSGTASNGATGGTAVADVLANDTLNGAAATLAAVNLTQVSTTNGNVTLAAATGAVNVAPATPAGTYTVVYQICEQLNPTNCDTADVVVTVGAAPIVATDDSGTVGSGASGGTAVADVLLNDTLNGAAATLATVNLTQASTTNPNVTLDVATGAVTVAPGTATGTYTVVYQICEQLNPTNCTTGTVTVTVGAAPIVATDDSGTVTSGASGGTAVATVLVNDTLNDAAATLSTVTLSQVSTSSANVTLDATTGAVMVAAGTAVGTYALVYQACEQLNPSNCDTANVVVTVGAAPIVATDDSGAVSNGAAGGTAVSDVLANDTLNDAAATLGTVNLTQVSTTNPSVTLDAATGAVSVAAATPAGTYTLVYQICEQLNPDSCDTAEVVVTVGVAPVVAVDDAGTLPANSDGGLAVANVLANDTLNGVGATLATVNLAQVSATNPNVTLDAATGAVTVAAGTVPGTYTLVYEICERLNPTNCTTAVVTVTVPEPEPGTIRGSVWLDTQPNRVRDPGESGLANFGVEIIDATTGERVECVSGANNRCISIQDPATGASHSYFATDADGNYDASGLPRGTYLLRFRDSANGVSYATPVNGAGDPNSSVEPSGDALRIQLNGGVTIVDQSLPVDPSGVTYDSTSRQPIAGARVTICGPQAAFSTANPLTSVLIGDGYATQPGAPHCASMVTGTIGIYQFLFAGGAPSGEYTLAAEAAGYIAPSELLPAEATALTPPAGTGPYRVQPQATPPQGSDSTIHYLRLNIGPGTRDVVNNHIPLDLPRVGALSLTKTGSVTVAEAGDSVQYTLRLTAQGGRAIGVVITDRLPTGFRYIAGSLRVNGTPAADPAGADTAVLEIPVGDLVDGDAVDVGYRLRVGVGASQGDGINRARASTTFGEQSNEARYRVRVEGGVFGIEACLVGKVFVDCNGNQAQDPEELGIPGVRMYFSDGTYLVSDVEGKYSYCGLKPRTQTLKVDRTTLPRGARLVTSSNRNALDPNSLFIEPMSGEMVRADFIEGSCSNAVVAQVKARRAHGEVPAPESEGGGLPSLTLEQAPAGAPKQATDTANQPMPRPRSE